MLAVGYGFMRIDDIRTSDAGAKSLDIALVQGNIDQSIKWNPNYQNETLNIYRDLSLEASARRPGTKLIVWPETAAPFFFQNIDEKHREILSITERTNSYLLFGNPRYEGNYGSYVLKNSAYMVSPVGEIAGRYDKVHLVPFGEYVPLKGLLFFVDKLVAGIGDFKAGAGFALIAINGDRIGVLICYEGIFPEISREYRLAGAGLLVNLTNDAWYGRTSAPYQHLTMVQFRAVENRLYIVRAANTGISAIIGPDGAIKAQTSIFERAFINGTVKIMEGSTFYSRNGDEFAWCVFAFTGMLFLFAVRRR
ncbi:MAG: apolipoprotein N-acyltransferase [Deltaproteobacteria bacterium]|nr:apolipoprotein N-acyltransferase [Deltaproteobacteria bacterium]